MKADTWFTQPPRWADPDALPEDEAAKNAAAFMAAAGSGKRI